MAEFDLIAQIKARAGQRDDVLLGIGDDAAVLAPPPGHQLVATCDSLNAGVHFAVDAAAADVGWKALAVNLSDLAAMGAKPAWVLLALTMPQADAAFVDSFLDGFCALAKREAVALVGGDTTRGPLSATVTALGHVPNGTALTRAGAKIGDIVCVSGTLGDAAAALHMAQQQAESDSDAGAVLRTRLQRPTPRVALGVALRHRAHAAIDLSDGILADLGHIARASGVGIELNAETLPCSNALKALFNPSERLRFQATGGEDYELAFSVPAHRWPEIQTTLNETGVSLHAVGRVVAGEGVTLHDGQGMPIRFDQHGWDHFSESGA